MTTTGGGTDGVVVATGVAGAGVVGAVASELTALVLTGAGPGAGVGPGGVALAGGAASAATRRQRSTWRL